MNEYNEDRFLDDFEDEEVEQEKKVCEIAEEAIEDLDNVLQELNVALETRPSKNLRNAMKYIMGAMEHLDRITYGEYQ